MRKTSLIQASLAVRAIPGLLVMLVAVAWPPIQTALIEHKEHGVPFLCLELRLQATRNSCCLMPLLQPLLESVRNSAFGASFVRRYVRNVLLLQKKALTLIKEGCKDESKDATAARGKLKEAWDAQIVGKGEAEVQSTFKVWRGRRPLKQTKGQKHLKLFFCMADPLESALSRYLLLTGGIQKTGRAPKDYIEREAATQIK